MDFYQRVAVECKTVPAGKVATYGQIALLCGKPKNSRQVGYALKHNFSGDNLPAHRIVNHQGYLSGAGCFQDPDKQDVLLMEEGVEVSSDLRVDLKKYGWKNTLEDALCLRAYFEKTGI